MKQHRLKDTLFSAGAVFTVFRKGFGEGAACLVSIQV